MRSNCLHCNTEFIYRPSQSTGKFCSNTCQMRYQYETVTLPKYRAGQISERKTLRKILIEERGTSCSQCKGSEWQNQPMPLEIDHKDGNAGNNLPSNIRLLCPNCHALDPHSKGRNRGHGRKARGLRTN